MESGAGLGEATEVWWMEEVKDGEPDVVWDWVGVVDGEWDLEGAAFAFA